MRATAILTVLLAVSCARVLPWRDQEVGNEVNLAFSLDRNLVELPSIRVNNRSGRFILGSAAPRTILDDDFAGKGPHSLQIGEKHTVRISPSRIDLAGAADAIIGVDAWNNRAISIDYRSGLVTFQKEGIHPGLMKMFEYEVEPSVYVTVDGNDVAAIVDTSSPDTLVLPSRTKSRGNAHVVVAGTDFGTVDVQYANVAHARIGNRLLSRFLVSIDYGRRVVGLWRDPRIPL